MKTALNTILALFFFINTVSAQDLHEWPIDPKTGRISFKEVVKEDSTKKDALYLKAKTWVSKTFKSAKDVIQIDDKEGGLLGLKGVSVLYFYSTYDRIEVKTEVYLNYLINLEFKDGRYRYEITDLTCKTLPPYAYTFKAEDWLIPTPDLEKRTEEEFNKQKFSAKTKKRAKEIERKTREEYNREIKIAVDHLISSLKEALSTQQADGEDW